MGKHSDPPSSWSASSLVACWYVASVVNNVFTKQALSIFPFPVLLCAVSVSIQAIAENFLAGRSTFHAMKRSKEISVAVSKHKMFIPITLAMAGSPLAHRLALAAGPVALVLTVKSLSTVFIALLSWAFLGLQPSLSDGIAIILTTLGVGVACSTRGDATFNATCALAALLSGACVSVQVILTKLVVRDVLSAYLRKEKEGKDDNTRSVPSAAEATVVVFRWSICGAALWLLPAAILMNGPSFYSWMSDWLSVNHEMAVTALAPLLSSIALCLSSTVGLWLMLRFGTMTVAAVTPLAHGIANAGRTVFVIVFATLVVALYARLAPLEDAAGGMEAKPLPPLFPPRAALLGSLLTAFGGLVFAFGRLQRNESGTKKEQ